MSLENKSSQEINAQLTAQAREIKQYKAPHLVSFGQITDMTAGGSMGDVEMGMGTDLGKMP